MSRDAILARVREALTRPTPVHPDRPAPAPPPPAADGSDPLITFRERFVALGGTWHEVDDGEGLARVVRDLMGTTGETAWVAAGGPGLLDATGLATRLAAMGVSVVGSLAEARDPDRIRVGVTGIELAIADSATLVLASRQGQGRLPSALTPVHVAVFRRDQVVPSLGAALRQIQPLLETGETGAVILVSGPSRTADIEGRLVIGVHGPGAIHAVLLG